jgi:hypothetical protein
LFAEQILTEHLFYARYCIGIKDASIKNIFLGLAQVVKHLPNKHKAPLQKKKIVFDSLPLWNLCSKREDKQK